jgi:hypothetical protein
MMRRSKKKNRRRKKNEKTSAFYGVFIWAFLFCFNSYYLLPFYYIASTPWEKLFFIQYMKLPE